MTEIYLHFRCTHYGLYGNAPVYGRMVAWPAITRCMCVASHPTRSDIAGSEPRPVGLLSGACARLIRLSDGRLLMTYGRRRPPYGLYATLSSDHGQKIRVFVPSQPQDVHRLPLAITIAWGRCCIQAFHASCAHSFTLINPMFMYSFRRVVDETTAGACHTGRQSGLLLLCATRRWQRVHR